MLSVFFLSMDVNHVSAKATVRRGLQSMALLNIRNQAVLKSPKYFGTILGRLCLQWNGLME